MKVRKKFWFVPYVPVAMAQSSSRESIADMLTKLLDLSTEHSEQRTMEGTADVVRNGSLSENELQTDIGSTVKPPKVQAKAGAVPAPILLGPQFNKGKY